MEIALIILCAVFAVLFLVVRVKVGGFWGLITKTLASFAFVSAGVFSLINATNFNNSIVFVILGLTSGLIGDILLDLKVIYRQDNKKFLNAGMTSFGIGHIFYFISLIMLTSPNMTFLSVIISVLAAIGLSLLIMQAGKLMKLNFKGFYLQILSYTFILTFLSIISFWQATINASLIPFFLGTFLIWLSDLVLSKMYFGGKGNDNILCIINHALYYAGQISIAAFLLFAF
ncbi:MAG: lysoplasmalogenase family protein [Clostridia bacterium]